MTTDIILTDLIDYYNRKKLAMEETSFIISPSAPSSTKRGSTSFTPGKNLENRIGRKRYSSYTQVDDVKNNHTNQPKPKFCITKQISGSLKHVNNIIWNTLSGKSNNYSKSTANLPQLELQENMYIGKPRNVSTPKKATERIRSISDGCSQVNKTSMEDIFEENNTQDFKKDNGSSARLSGFTKSKIPLKVSPKKKNSLKPLDITPRNVSTPKKATERIRSISDGCSQVNKTSMEDIFEENNTQDFKKDNGSSARLSGFTKSKIPLKVSPKKKNSLKSLDITPQKMDKSIQCMIPSEIYEIGNKSTDYNNEDARESHDLTSITSTAMDFINSTFKCYDEEIERLKKAVIELLAGESDEDSAFGSDNGARRAKKFSNSAKTKSKIPIKDKKIKSLDIEVASSSYPTILDKVNTYANNTYDYSTEDANTTQMTEEEYITLSETAFSFIDNELERMTNIVNSMLSDDDNDFGSGPSTSKMIPTKSDCRILDPRNKNIYENQVANISQTTSPNSLGEEVGPFSISSSKDSDFGSDNSFDFEDECWYAPNASNTMPIKNDCQILNATKKTGYINYGYEYEVSNISKTPESSSLAMPSTSANSLDEAIGPFSSSTEGISDYESDNCYGSKNYKENLWFDCDDIGSAKKSKCQTCGMYNNLITVLVPPHSTVQIITMGEANNYMQEEQSMENEEIYGQLVKFEESLNDSIAESSFSKMEELLVSIKDETSLTLKTINYLNRS